MSTTPYRAGFTEIAMMAMGTCGALTVGVWRGILYDFGAFDWFLAAAACLLGVGCMLAIQKRLGYPSLRGLLGFALVAAFVLEVFRRRLDLPREVGALLVLFSGGAFLAQSVAMANEVAKRWQETRRWLAETGSGDPAVKSQVEEYFRASARLEGELDSEGRALRRALRRLSSVQGPSWNAAAEALRTYAAALATYGDLAMNVPHPPCLDALAHEIETARQSLQDACLRAAAELEAGRRSDLAEFWAANRGVLETGRRWQYAIGLLASRHRVSVPRWFIRLNAQLAKAG